MIMMEQGFTMFSSSLDIKGNQVEAKSFARFLKQVVRHLINHQASCQHGSLIVSIDCTVTCKHCIASKYCQLWWSGYLGCDSVVHCLAHLRYKIFFTLVIM